MFTLILAMCLCSCGKDSNKKSDAKTDNITNPTENNNVNDNEIDDMEQVTDVNTNDDSNSLTSGLYINFYQYTDEEKKDKKIYDDFIFIGQKMNFEMSTTINLAGYNSDTIEVMAMVLVDNLPVPFVLENSDEKIINVFEITNGEELKQNFSFTPKNIKSDESIMTVLLIPCYNQMTTDIYNNSVILQSKYLSSEVETAKGQEIVYSNDYIQIEDTTELYGKTLNEISEYNGFICDFILENEDGKLYYMGDKQEGDYITYLFCDGELYGGFDGLEYFAWKKQESGYVNKEIDINGLASGKHYMFAVTCKNTDGVMSVVEKSLNTEIEIP